MRTQIPPLTPDWIDHNRQSPIIEVYKDADVAFIKAFFEDVVKRVSFEPPKG